MGNNNVTKYDDLGRLGLLVYVCRAVARGGKQRRRGRRPRAHFAAAGREFFLGVLFLHSRRCIGTFYGLDVHLFFSREFE